jgi:hypothetical protein
MAQPNEREIESKIITKFRGISQYRSITEQPMDYAQDLLNVIVSGAGHLEKLRFPITKSVQVTIDGKVQGLIDTLYDFQQANGTRQLIAGFLAGLGFYTEPVIGGVYNFTLIEGNAIDSPRYSYVDSNNLLFLTNGIRNLRWDGANLRNWGITRPAAAPTIGYSVPIKSIQRAANVVTVVLDISAIPNNVVNGFHPAQLITLPVGSPIKIDGIAADHSAEGIITTTVQPADYSFSYASNGANFGPVAQGTATVYYTPCANTGADISFNITTIQRGNGILTVFFKNNYRVLAGELFTMSGFVGAQQTPLNGEFLATASDLASVSFANPGPDIGLTAASGAPVMKGGFSDQLGARTWKYSYGASIIGDESAVSDQSLAIPNGNDGLVSNVRAYLNAAASADPQVDTIYWYATLDSGSDWFLENGPSTLNPAGGQLVATGLGYGDGNPDDNIDLTQRGSLINFPPPLSTRLSKWQGRIYMVPSANPQSIVYTGYEKILRGRPECNVPPGNVILLNIGANTIKAHGPLMNGVVIWDSVDKLFMFKGTVEDIVTNQPVNYSEQVEEMPWQIGCMSHQTVQSTPYGVIWFGTDKTFHKWNGIFYGEIIGPTDIGQNIYPLLARITPGTEVNVQTAYFNFLERDWYVALIAIDGSATPNRMLFFDVSKDASDNLGVFVSNIEADAICSRTDANGTKRLLVSVHGIVYEIKAATTATAGVHTVLTNTNNLLDAFWLSGYDGGDTPLTMKMYRFGRIVTDQMGFRLLATLIDDETSTLALPTNMRELQINAGGKFSVNWKARRCSLGIQFPNQDTDASVLQLALTHIPLSDR